MRERQGSPSEQIGDPITTSGAALQPRIQHMFWKGHNLSALVMAERYS